MGHTLSPSCGEQAVSPPAKERGQERMGRLSNCCSLAPDRLNSDKFKAACLRSKASKCRAIPETPLLVSRVEVSTARAVLLCHAIALLA